MGVNLEVAEGVLVCVPTHSQYPSVKVPGGVLDPLRGVEGWGQHPSDQMEWTARPSGAREGANPWDREGRSDPAVEECALRQQSGWRGGARSWGAGDRGGPLYRGWAESELQGPAGKSLQTRGGPARRFVGEWLPLPTRRGGPGKPKGAKLKR